MSKKEFYERFGYPLWVISEKAEILHKRGSMPAGWDRRPAGPAPTGKRGFPGPPRGAIPPQKASRLRRKTGGRGRGEGRKKEAPLWKANASACSTTRSRRSWTALRTRSSTTRRFCKKPARRSRSASRSIPAWRTTIRSPSSGTPASIPSSGSATGRVTRSPRSRCRRSATSGRT